MEEIFVIFDFCTGNSVNFGVIKLANLTQTIWGAGMAENGKAAGASSHTHISHISPVNIYVVDIVGILSDVYVWRFKFMVL